MFRDVVMGASLGSCLLCRVAPALSGDDRGLCAREKDGYGRTLIGTLNLNAATAAV
jgi:hypothetical protein